MSPYQSQVMEASLAEFDRNAQMQQQGLRDQAVASGAFGGGREGVVQSEYMSRFRYEQSTLQAGLLQQGFGQAQQAAQQQFQNQHGISSAITWITRNRYFTFRFIGRIESSANTSRT